MSADLGCRGGMVAGIAEERMRIQTSEADIQKAVLEWLNTIPGIYVWRRNVGMTTSVYKGKKRVIRYGYRGQADLEGIGPNGIHLEIEIKRLGQKPTAAQRDWLLQAQGCGSIAFCCDSLQSCTASLRVSFRNRGWRWDPNWEVQ